MNKEVYKTAQFADYAQKNLVLLKADFPQPDNQPEAVKKQNQELSTKYKVNAFPTTVAVDADGKELGREVGYGGGGPKGHIAVIEKMKKR